MNGDGGICPCHYMLWETKSWPTRKSHVELIRISDIQATQCKWSSRPHPDYHNNLRFLRMLLLHTNHLIRRLKRTKRLPHAPAVTHARVVFRSTSATIRHRPRHLPRRRHRPHHHHHPRHRPHHRPQRPNHDLPRPRNESCRNIRWTLAARAP